MGRLRIATYKVEWMNNLFVKGTAAFRDKPGKAMGRNPKDPVEVARRLAAVIEDVAADIIGIQEGPAHIEQMKHFVKKCLGNAYTVFGMESGSQSIYALVRKGIECTVRQYDSGHKYYDHLRRATTFQPWGEVNNGIRYRMARPPVLLQLRVPGSSDLVHVVVVHTKSQFTQGLTAKRFRERDPDAMKAAILSRQKLSADIAAYRRHVTHAILSEQAQGVILLGDINDGFTRNTFEKEFLMQSLVDELRGGFRRQNALLEHVMTQEQLSSTSAYTVVFRDPEKAQKPTKELIDHILVTRNIHDRTIDLKLRRGSAQIGHDVSARHTDNGGDDASTRPSDHVPVWVDFEYR